MKSLIVLQIQPINVRMVKIPHVILKQGNVIV